MGVNRRGLEKGRVGVWVGCRWGSPELRAAFPAPLGCGPSRVGRGRASLGFRPPQPPLGRKKRQGGLANSGAWRCAPDGLVIGPVDHKVTALNAVEMNPLVAPAAALRVEFFRLPTPGRRDPHFGLSRSWYYKAAALGEIKMVAVRQRGALRGVRLVVYDSVADYIRRAAESDVDANAPV